MALHLWRVFYTEIFESLISVSAEAIGLEQKFVAFFSSKTSIF